MFSKTLTTSAATVALALMGATSAQAVTIPRLAGSYSVKTTIIAHQHPGGVGDTATKTWKFTPSCSPSRGCTTTMVRPRNTGHPNSVSTVLKPVKSSTGAWHYKGSKTYLSACFLNSGRIVDHAYSTKETTNLTVTSTNRHNIVTAFKGIVVLVFTPTASAPSGCTADKLTLKAVSIKRL